MNIVDISAVPKTAENLLDFVLREIAYCRDVLETQLVAWCTDSSGEGLKMRRLLRSKLPWLVTVACWAHQVRSFVKSAIYSIYSSGYGPDSVEPCRLGLFQDQAPPYTCHRPCP